MYADYEENLPVTTPEQTQASIDLFTKHADKWSASDRMLYSARLEKAAAYYGIDAELPYATTEMSKHASGAIDLRLRIMDEVTRGVESEDFSEYYDGMEVIKEAMSDVREYEDILKIAQAIEDLDKDFGMDEAWGVQVPDPVDSITEGFNADPFSEVDKKAQTDWDSVNWEELPFEDDVVDAIKSDPETIIPTLPMAQRNIVEDHING
ncbi:hypothetical protein GWM83_02770 [Candidatus Bathyarchaeota archaeon]|nr:hypothetical protein [Candidatus Bathyarchaeota archaeon]NIR15071.1 hypothetical protein [Desulfobacterales bacterium]NIW34468.1 hypothetical protein [Candidatus Bathyarchaeota archaeon]